MLSIKCKTQTMVLLITRSVHIDLAWQMMLTNQLGFSQEQAQAFDPPSSLQWLFRMTWLRNQRGRRPTAQPDPTYSWSSPLCQSIPLKHFQVSVGGRSATLWHGPLMLMAGNESRLCICHWTNGASVAVVCPRACFCISMIFFLP